MAIARQQEAMLLEIPPVVCFPQEDSMIQRLYSALGISLETLADCWQSEAVYQPKISQEERQRRLAKWNKALEAVKVYHS